MGPNNPNSCLKSSFARNYYLARCSIDIYPYSGFLRTKLLQ